MSHIAVERALVLLRYIVDHPDGLSIREVSREYGYSPATVQKLVSALQNQDFIVQDKQTERYHLGPEAVQLGLAALSQPGGTESCSPLPANVERRNWGNCISSDSRAATTSRISTK